MTDRITAFAAARAICFTCATFAFGCSAGNIPEERTVVDAGASDVDAGQVEPACLDAGRSCIELDEGDLCGGCRAEPLHGECTAAGTCAWTIYEH